MLRTNLRSCCCRAFILDQVIMRLLRLLYRNSAWQLATAVVASVLSGVAELGTTICVLESFRRGKVLWWQFALVAVFALLIARYSRAAVGRLTAQSIVRMRRRLVRSVLHLPLLELEAIGATRLLVAFTGDLVNVATAVRNLVLAFRKCGHSTGLLSLYWLAVDAGDGCRRIAMPRDASPGRSFCARSKNRIATRPANPGTRS